MKRNKRDIWSDREIREMLNIINKKHIVQLNKIKRNKNIFVDVARELKKKDFIKNDVQIRYKFKSLKSDFYKAKRRNNINGAKRQTSEHFDLLDEIFGNPPALEAVGVDAIEMDMMDEAESIQSSEEEDAATCKSQGFEGTKNDSNQQEVDTCMVDESQSSMPCNEDLPCPVEEEEPSFISSQDEKPTTSKSRRFRRVKKNSYQKVVETFTKEWKCSQAEMLQQIREHDEKLVDYQVQRQEEIMERNRKAMKEMLEEDRLETSKMLQDFLNALQPAQSYMIQEPQLFATEQSLAASPVLLPKLSPQYNEDDS